MFKTQRTRISYKERDSAAAWWSKFEALAFRPDSSTSLPIPSPLAITKFCAFGQYNSPSCSESHVKQHIISTGFHHFHSHPVIGTFCLRPGTDLRLLQRGGQTDTFSVLAVAPIRWRKPIAASESLFYNLRHGQSSKEQFYIWLK
jgi:hypothetical protein